jgi:ribonuclease HI
MKKKNLTKLNDIKKALEKYQLYSQECSVAFESLKTAINELPEEKEKPLDNAPLPVPPELNGVPQGIAVFSDGGCRGNPGPGAFAYVIQDHEGTVLKEAAQVDNYTTNNKMELSGVIEGLNGLQEILPTINRDALLQRVVVVTDSKYVVDGMNSWVAGWKSRGWKKADGKAPENVELWMKLDQKINSFFEVKFQWVRGHGGHPQNERCDQLANKAMDEAFS